MIKVLSYYIKNQLNAGPKAKYDVEDILVQQLKKKKERKTRLLLMLK